MKQRFSTILVLAVAIFALGSAALSQSADNTSSVIPKAGDDSDHPKSLRETLEKMRIQKEKKEFAEMIERGEEALKLTEDVEKAFAIAGRLDSTQLNKLATVEKLVKKIRSELGGDDDESDEEKDAAAKPANLEKAEMIRSFRSTTVKLLDELKKTTRFTVSAAAIQASNAVLKIARILKISR